MSFFKELKRRNVFRAGIAYLLAAWVLLADRFMGSRGSYLASDVSEAESSPPTTVTTDPDLAAGRQAAGVSDEKAAGKATPIEKSIAVLPFLALSNGPDDEYFADGLTEEILNSLAQLPELLVTARTSAFHFKGKDVPIQEIAAQLGVATVVEGSVRRSGDRLRVTAQLIRAADGFHLWSENYDSTSQDTISVQEDIAEKIATAMNVVMDEGKRKAMQQAGLRDVEALSTNILWCLCGEGWDLDVTPNFAAKIEASGLPWPPASPIKFPLKNW